MDYEFCRGRVSALVFWSTLTPSFDPQRFSLGAGLPNKHRLQGVPGGGVPGHGGEVERVKLGVELGTHLWVRRTLRCVIREVRLTGVGSRLGHVARC